MPSRVISAVLIGHGTLKNVYEAGTPEQARFEKDKPRNRLQHELEKLHCCGKTSGRESSKLNPKLFLDL